MPQPLLGAFMAMLPRLQAEEALRHVSELLAATPEVEQRVRRRIIGDMERQARAEEEANKLTPDELSVRLALAGIGIRKVKK